MCNGNIFYKDYCDYLVENLENFTAEHEYHTNQFKFCGPDVYDYGNETFFELIAYGFFPDGNPSGSRYGYGCIEVPITFDKDSDISRIWHAINDFIAENQLEE